MKFANKIRAGFSASIIFAMTLITSTPAQAQFVSALDSWPTNWPGGVLNEQERTSKKQTTLSLPSGRFGLSVFKENSNKSENK